MTGHALTPPPVTVEMSSENTLATDTPEDPMTTTTEKTASTVDLLDRAQAHLASAASTMPSGRIPETDERLQLIAELLAQLAEVSDERIKLAASVDEIDRRLLADGYGDSDRVRSALQHVEAIRAGRANPLVSRDADIKTEALRPVEAWEKKWGYRIHDTSWGAAAIDELSEILPDGVGGEPR